MKGKREFFGKMKRKKEFNTPVTNPHRQASKRKNSEGEDSKPGKSGKRKDFKRFKGDLAQVVIEGKCTDELQYIMETDVTHLYACYLIACFGGVTEALRTEGHQMIGNQEVMDLWARFSGEGMSKMTSE